MPVPTMTVALSLCFDHFWQGTPSRFPRDGEYQLERVHGSDEAEERGVDPDLEHLEPPVTEDLLQLLVGRLAGPIFRFLGEEISFFPLQIDGHLLRDSILRLNSLFV